MYNHVNELYESANLMTRLSEVRPPGVSYLLEGIVIQPEVLLKGSKD